MWALWKERIYSSRLAAAAKKRAVAAAAPENGVRTLILYIYGSRVLLLLPLGTIESVDREIPLSLPSIKRAAQVAPRMAPASWILVSFYFGGCTRYAFSGTRSALFFVKVLQPAALSPRKLLSRAAIAARAYYRLARKEPRQQSVWWCRPGRAMSFSEFRHWIGLLRNYGHARARVVLYFFGRLPCIQADSSWRRFEILFSWWTITRV